MKGLVYKDFVTLMGVYKKNLLLVAVLYGGMALAMQNDFFLYFGIWMMGFYGLTAFSLDTQCGWDRYARTLPVEDWKIVAAKFVTGLLFVGMAVVYALVLGVAGRLLYRTLAQEWGELLYLIGIITAVVVAATGVMYFLAIKFSPDKARSYFMIVFIGGFAGFFLLAKTRVIKAEQLMESLKGFGLWLDSHVVLTVVLALAAAAVVLLVMLAAACAVYRRKEF